MSKKDYELIANSINYMLVRGWVTYRGIQYLTDSLSTTNKKFDKSKFLKACGVQE